VRRAALLVVAAVAALGLAGCGDGATAQPAGTGADQQVSQVERQLDSLQHDLDSDSG
jgi:outer membrane biogenesis lipoprotein LolB